MSELSASPASLPAGPRGSDPGLAGDRVESLVVHLVFIASGVSALLYQLIWQRSLLMIYGSNTESVAVVVAAFLIGLGLGSILGGAVSRRPGAPLVLLFSGTELLIGLYGLCSLPLFHWVGEYTLTAGTLATGWWAFALVLAPTLLMGATLPLLVAYRVRASGQVGLSVSGLYFVNTLGAALGAFAGAIALFALLGLSGTARVAAGLNLLSSLAVLLLRAKRRRAP